MSTCMAIAIEKEGEVQRERGLAGMLARACTTSGRTSSPAKSTGHHVSCRKDVKFFNTLVRTMLKIGVDLRKAFLTVPSSTTVRAEVRAC